MIKVIACGPSVGPSVPQDLQVNRAGDGLTHSDLNSRVSGREIGRHVRIDLHARCGVGWGEMLNGKAHVSDREVDIVAVSILRKTADPYGDDAVRL